MIPLLDIAINPVSSENARIFLNETEGGKTVMIQQQQREKMITPDDPEVATTELHVKSKVQNTVKEQLARHNQRTGPEERNRPPKSVPRRENAMLHFTIRKTYKNGGPRVDLVVHDNLYVVEASIRT